MIDCPLPQVSGPTLIKRYSSCIDNSPAPESFFYSHGTVFTLEYCISTGYAIMNLIFNEINVSYELEHVSIVDEVSHVLNRNASNRRGSNLIAIFHLLFTTNHGISGM